MGKMSLTSCRALSTPGKFSNVDRYEVYVFRIIKKVLRKIVLTQSRSMYLGVSRHLGNAHLANGHLANGHLVNGHLANGHLANKCMGGHLANTQNVSFQ